MRHPGAPSKSSPRSVESIDATATISKALGPLNGSASLGSSLAWPGFGACVDRTRSTGPRPLIPPGFRALEANPLGNPGRAHLLGDRPGATLPRTGPPILASGRSWRLAHHRAGRWSRGREGLQLREGSPRVGRGRSRQRAGLKGGRYRPLRPEVFFVTLSESIVAQPTVGREVLHQGPQSVVDQRISSPPLTCRVSPVTKPASRR